MRVSYGQSKCCRHDDRLSQECSQSWMRLHNFSCKLSVFPIVVRGWEISHRKSVWRRVEIFCKYPWRIGLYALEFLLLKVLVCGSWFGLDRFSGPPCILWRWDLRNSNVYELQSLFWVLPSILQLELKEKLQQNHIISKYSAKDFFLELTSINTPFQNSRSLRQGHNFECSHM